MMKELATAIITVTLFFIASLYIAIRLYYVGDIGAYILCAAIGVMVVIPLALILVEMIYSIVATLINLYTD